MNYYNWLIPIILILLLGGFYLGLKIKVFWHFTKQWQKVIYWLIIYLFISFSFLFRTIITGFLLYFLLLCFIYDIIHFIFKKWNKIRIILETFYCKGIPFILISILITFYGAYNLQHPIIKEYNVKINDLKSDIVIGMISDLHLGILHEEDIFSTLLAQANSLHADLFILNGDIFDEYTPSKLKSIAYDKLSQIKTTYGIYYVEGNHDLLTTKVRKEFEEHQIKVLDDQVITINDTINLIGRKDYRNNKLHKPRQELQNLVSQTNPLLPTIDIDHQPKDQKKSQSLGIDLQLSGHTHAGQLFPGNFVLQYGYQKNENYQIIVSSGYGAWAFPIRTAGHCEMLKINLKGV